MKSRIANSIRIIPYAFFFLFIIAITELPHRKIIASKSAHQYTFEILLVVLPRADRCAPCE